MTDNGLITVASSFPAGTTIERLVAAISARGISMFARIDHARNAADAGMTLRPTCLVIFGNPKAGTPLMEEQQTIGLDLPLKVLVWEDEHGKAWLTRDSIAWLAQRHGLRITETASALDAALAAIVREAGGTQG